MMAAVGTYRFVLHPNADADAFESRVSSMSGEHVLQLTRVTSGFDERLFEVTRPSNGEEDRHYPRPQYVWEVTVHLVTGGHLYDFAGSADRVQEAVADLATLVSVEGLRPVEATA
jgi:hypothetical protein